MKERPFFIVCPAVDVFVRAQNLSETAEELAKQFKKRELYEPGIKNMASDYEFASLTLARLFIDYRENCLLCRHCGLFQKQL